MDLTASKSKQITAILIGEQTAKSPLFHVEQFLNDFYNEIEEKRREAVKGAHFQQRKQNNVHHQGQQQQYIPGKKTVGKGV